MIAWLLLLLLLLLLMLVMRRRWILLLLLLLLLGISRISRTRITCTVGLVGGRRSSLSLDFGSNEL
jgi:hypothetical protein